jgi:hypothetical protein
VTARARTALSTLVLAAIAAAAIGVAMRGDRQAGDARAAERVFSFAADDVRELTVTARGDTTRLVRGADRRWRLVAPVEGDADQHAANGIAEELASLRRTGEAAPAGSDLAPFGLVSPTVKIEVALAGGGREALAVGDQSAFDGSLFVRPTSGAVLVVPGSARWRLERDSADLKAKPAPEQAAGAGDAPAPAAGPAPPEAAKAVDPERPSP